MKSSRCNSLIDNHQFSKLLSKKPTRIGCFDVYKEMFSEQTILRELGFIIPKRQVKLAVLRNKIKRLTHESLRLVPGSFRYLVKVNRLITKKNIAEEILGLKKVLQQHASLN